MLDIKDLYIKGLNQLKQEHDKLETEKVGTLRGGNTGAMTADGVFLGKCPSLTYLRYKGVQVPDTEIDINNNKHLMFSAGRLNELDWYETLKAADPDIKMLREEEIPTSWMTESGVPVTGRPDLVILNQDGSPKRGIELKLVSAYYTAKSVLFSKEPKFDHIAQAAHYSWQLKCDFELWYTSRADFAIPAWQEKYLPKQGEPLSEYLEYNNKGGVKKVRPFIQGYEIKISNLDSYVYYKDLMIPGAGYVRSALSVDMIKRFYEFITEMDEYAKVPPPPQPVSALGEATYKAQDYCELAKHGLCCGQKCGDDLKQWAEQVTNLTEKK